MRRPKLQSGLTLIELVVACGILVLIMLGVGYIFTQSTRAVNMAETTMEMHSSMRASSGQIREDFRSLAKDGFLCIVEPKITQVWDLTAGQPINAPPPPGTTYAFYQYASPPVIMFTAAGQYQSIEPAKLMSNNAVIVYSLAKDGSFGEANPNILGRYQYLLTGKAKPRTPGGIQAFIEPPQSRLNPNYDVLNESITDVLVAGPTLIRTDFVKPFATRNYSPTPDFPFVMHTAPASVQQVQNLWPYMIGGVRRMDVEYAYGRDPNTGKLVWLRPSLEPISGNPGHNPSVKTGYVDQPANSGVYALWTGKNKDGWPKAIRITLYMVERGQAGDPYASLDPQARPYEFIFNLP